jgi:GntR family transcriptional regulator
MGVAVPAVKRGRGPAHAQIEAWLANAVAAGRLSPGDRLPPERELAGRLGVSRMTVRHALASLERRGLVARRVGRSGGTFVAEPKLELAGLAALSDQLRGLGLVAGARVLSARELAPDTAVGDALGLAPAARVYEIVRVRLADGEPVALERTSFLAEAFPGLLDGPLEGSLYDLIRARYRDVPVRAVERLEATVADEEDAQALGVRPGVPLLRTERIAYGESGRPLEHSRDLFRGDRTRVIWESEIKGPAV